MAEEKKDVEQALAESLKELVQRMPFDKITIKKITDGAGVIRVTFYNHFQDKYDLLGYIVQSEILEPVGILLKNNMYKEALTLIFTNLKKDSEFYQKAVRIEGSASTGFFWTCSARGAAESRIPSTLGLLSIHWPDITPDQ